MATARRRRTGPTFGRSPSRWIQAKVAARFPICPSAHHASFYNESPRSASRPAPAALLHKARAPRGSRHRHGLQVATSLRSSPLLLLHTLHISSSIQQHPPAACSSRRWPDAARTSKTHAAASPSLLPPLSTCIVPKKIWWSVEAKSKNASSKTKLRFQQK